MALFVCTYFLGLEKNKNFIFFLNKIFFLLVSFVAKGRSKVLPSPLPLFSCLNSFGEGGSKGDFLRSPSYQREGLCQCHGLFCS